MATSLDQLEQLNALFRPVGESIANYGAMKFQLDQQRQAEERAAKLRLIQANR